MTEEAMPRVSSEVNQYAGVNIHLNDDLQDNWAEWSAFHDRFIGSLQDALNVDLIPRGYVAKTVPGLQVRSLDPDTGETGPTRNIRPDVGIQDMRPGRPGRPLSVSGDPGPRTIEMSLPEAMGRTDKEYYWAVAVDYVKAIPGRQLPQMWRAVRAPH